MMGYLNPEAFNQFMNAERRVNRRERILKNLDKTLREVRNYPFGLVVVDDIMDSREVLLDRVPY